MSANVAAPDPNAQRFTCTISREGRIVFDLGPNPSPELVEKARKLAEGMGGPYVAEAKCLSDQEREALAQKLAAMLMRGAS